MYTRRLLSGIGLVAALALTACGGGGGQTGTPAASPAGGNGGGGAALDVQADPSGNFRFQQETLQATAEQPFTVNFNNPTSVEHNWVLVQPGQADAVANATIPTNGAIDGVSGVIAGHNPITNASETVQVDALQAGEYPYICTVPGHYQAGMRGTLTIR